MPYKRLMQIIGFTGVVALLGTSCGSGGSSGTSSGVAGVSVANIPSGTAMIKTNDSSTRSMTVRSGTIHNVRAVSGTAPILKDIGSGDVDTHFWGGLLATITGLGVGTTQTPKDEFWGKVVGGAGGMGACQMAQGVGESFSNLINSANTLCYMKGIASGPTGISVSSGLPSQVFTATASNKTIKINLSTDVTRAAPAV